MFYRRSHRFQVYSNESLVWSDAKAFCLAQGGALARAKNCDQWLQMIEAAGAEGPNFIWLDGKKEAGEDVFMCSNKEARLGFPCRFLPFAFGLPQVDEANGELCIGIVKLNSLTYVMSADACTFQLAVMCRFRLDVE